MVVVVERWAAALVSRRSLRQRSNDGALWQGSTPQRARARMQRKCPSSTNALHSLLALEEPSSLLLIVPYTCCSLLSNTPPRVEVALNTATLHVVGERSPQFREPGYGTGC